MMAVSSLAIDATLYKSLPYDPAKDLALVALVATVPFVLVVNPSLPATTVADLIKLAKERPLSYGSGGIGAFHHLAGALFANMAGIKMQHVPYRGTAPALNDLMGGYIQLMFSDMSAALPLINSGKIRALAVTTKQRVSALPDVPPLAEAGVPGYDVAAWQGVIAPAQTPEPILAKLNTEINAIVNGDEIRTRLKALGMIPAGTGTVPELQKFLDAEIVRWGQGRARRRHCRDRVDGRFSFCRPLDSVRYVRKRAVESSTKCRDPRAQPTRISKQLGRTRSTPSSGVSASARSAMCPMPATAGSSNCARTIRTSPTWC